MTPGKLYRVCSGTNHPFIAFYPGMVPNPFNYERLVLRTPVMFLEHFYYKNDFGFYRVLYKDKIGNLHVEGVSLEQA